MQVWAVGLLCAQLAAAPAAGETVAVDRVLGAPTAEAPPLPANIARGAKRLMFGLLAPHGGVTDFAPSIGGAWFVADRLALTLAAQVALDRVELVVPSAMGRETFTQVAAGLAPGVRYYLTGAAPVALFAEGAVQGGFRRVAVLSDGATNVGTGEVDNLGLLSFATGLGGEWFINPKVSLSGDMGLRLDVIRGRNIPAVALTTLATALRMNFSW